MTSSFPTIKFQGRLRPSQADVVAIAREQLADGQRKLHVVAPPGSGKTVLGLFLWAECIQVPALVLSPNSAIQAQWASRLDLFDGPGGLQSVASTDPLLPGLFTSLTYQSVTLPRRGGKDLDAEATEVWIEKLIEMEQAKDPQEAEIWIEDLKRHNRSYYDDRLSGYRKTVRDEIALAGEAMTTLHQSALSTLERLKERSVGLLILDECHHLLSHWGRVLADAESYLDHPIVLGLTATPPELRGKDKKDATRYQTFFGPVDYEVPVPAVVKDGFLAPYQDLVQFVRPTADELAYVANADDQLYELVEELCLPFDAESDALAEEEPQSKSGFETCAGESEALGATVFHGCSAPQERRPPGFETTPNSDGDAADSAPVTESLPRECLTSWLVRVLSERRLPIGAVVDWKTFAERDPGLTWAGPIFLQSRGLPLPPGVPKPKEGFASIMKAQKRAGSNSHRLPMPILVPVLDRYIRHRLRRSSDPADHQLAEKAISRLRMLGMQITETGSQACASPIGRLMAYARGKAEAIVPILKAERAALAERIRAIVVTDYEKTSAVTSEISHLLDKEAGGAVAAYRVLLQHPETDGLDPVLVTGSTVLVDDDSAPRFEAAAAEWLAAKKCKVELEFGKEDGFHIVSGRGRDWCPRVYVEMVTDLFQRGITKCLVGTRGLLGEGWDASKVNVLIDLTTVTTSTSVNQLRGRSMRLDSDDPAKLAHNWDVVCIAPEFTKGLDDYERFLKKHDCLFGVTDDGVIQKGVGHVHAAFTEIGPELVEESMGVLNAEMLRRPARRAEFRKLWRIGKPYNPEPIHALEMKQTGGGGRCKIPYAKPSVEWNANSLTQAIGRAILGALREVRLIKSRGDLVVERRAGDYVRAFLESAEEAESRLFGESLAEALGPLDNPRYVIHRYVDYKIDTWLSRVLPELVGQFFRRDHSEMEMLHAVPSPLAKNKDLAAIYGRHWNAHVSAGQPVYARSTEGEVLIEHALHRGTTPDIEVHRKEVFL